MTKRFAIAVFAVVFLIGACGGSGDDETTSTGSDDPTETTGGLPDTTEPDGGPSIGLDDIPQECIDAFVEYLQAIEPIIADVDWENATMADLEAAGNAIAAEGDFADLNPDCDELNVDASNEETFEYLLDLARDEAPDTLPYFEMLRDFVGGVDGGDGGDGGGEASGDCETDIATLQAMIDEGGTISDLAFADLALVGSLSSSIGVNCSQERSAEFFSQEDVTAFLGG